MGKYDFTTIMDRKGKDAIAVDAVGSGVGAAPGEPKEGFDVIPMWIADPQRREGPDTGVHRL